MKKNYSLPILLLCLLSAPFVHAQTPAENLQNGVEIYNALKTYVHGLTAETITADNITDIKRRVDRGAALMDQVIREGNSDEIKTARYFRANFQNEYAFSQGMKGDQKQCHTIYSTIVGQMSGYSSADFPLRYVYFGKNFIIKWDDFAPTQAEFLTGYAEVCFNNGYEQEAAVYCRKAINHPNITPWLRYIAINKLIDVAQKSSTHVPESEKLDLAVSAIKAYDALDSKSQDIVTQYKYPTVLRGSEILLKDAKAKNNRESANRCAEVLPILIKVGKTDREALQMFEICYKNNAAPSLSFAELAESHARKMKNDDPAASNFVALSAIEQQAAQIGYNDCDAMLRIAEKYRTWNRADKDKEWQKKSENCREERIKAEKRAAKAAKRSNSSFNVYAGMYIFPLLTTNPKRDYGGVLNFGGRKTMLEVSYLKVKQKKENIFDLWINEVDGAEQDNLSRWNGYYAHVQPKFMRKQAYWGLLFGTAKKTFDPMIVNCTHDASGAFTQATFNPTVDQYIMMLNFGGMSLLKGFGADMYMGIGANYSRFDAGTTINREEYTIDNPLLEYRKDAYFGLIVRMGFTMGLNFGRGNM